MLNDLLTQDKSFKMVYFLTVILALAL